MYFLRHLDKVMQLFQLIQEIRKICFLSFHYWFVNRR